MNNAATKSSGSTWSTLVGVIFIVAVGLGLAVWMKKQPVESGALIDPAVGAPLTSLSFTPLVGTESNVRSADLEGKVVLVNYWGTWCGPCRVEFPHMVELHNQFGSNPQFELVSVSVEYSPQMDLEQLRSETAAFVEREEAGFPVYADLNAVNRMQFMQLAGGVSGVPQTILLDRQGVVRAVWRGFRPGYEKEMATQIMGLLGGTSEEPAAE